MTLNSGKKNIPKKGLIWRRTTQKYGKSIIEEKHTKLSFDLEKNNRKIRICTCGGRRYENYVFPKTAFFTFSFSILLCTHVFHKSS